MQTIRYFYGFHASITNFIFNSHYFEPKKHLSPLRYCTRTLTRIIHPSSLLKVLECHMRNPAKPLLQLLNFLAQISWNKSDLYRQLRITMITNLGRVIRSTKNKILAFHSLRLLLTLSMTKQKVLSANLLWNKVISMYIL